MLHVVLYEPEIPPNTGNIMRLCANTGAHLHLIEPMGFRLDEKQCRRAGMDYRDWAAVTVYDDLPNCLEKNNFHKLYACTTKGKQRYDQVHFVENDALLFGPESRGLPRTVLDELAPEQRIRIPMQADSRSINLANAVSIILYEGLRQLDFPGCA